jgi:thioredoxin reductase (NADPH)
MQNIIIIGSGPAALTAAIYTGRAGLAPFVFEGFMAGGVPAGGQLMTTTDIENFPGFPDGISGPELMMRIRQQALNCGAHIETKTVDRVDFSKRPFTVFCGAEAFQANAVIIATGATAKRLQIEGEDRLWQKGISACAICDGGLPLFRNKPLVVIGGGDTAVEEALYLTKFASKVYVVHRRDELRASQIMQKRLFENKKIEMIWNHVPFEALGENSLTGVRVKSTKDVSEKILEVSGLFYAVGHLPNTQFLDGQIQTDEAGYIITLTGTTQTNVKGVFACGDVQDKRYRQAVTAAGTGCMAALETERFLSDNVV